MREVSDGGSWLVVKETSPFGTSCLPPTERVVIAFRARLAALDMAVAVD